MQQLGLTTFSRQSGMQFDFQARVTLALRRQPKSTLRVLSQARKWSLFIYFVLSSLTPPSSSSLHQNKRGLFHERAEKRNLNTWPAPHSELQPPPSTKRLRVRLAGGTFRHASGMPGVSHLDPLTTQPSQQCCDQNEHWW